MRTKTGKNILNISSVDRDTSMLVYNALIKPHFDYYCEVWDELAWQRPWRTSSEIPESSG